MFHQNMLKLNAHIFIEENSSGGEKKTWRMFPRIEIITSGQQNGKATIPTSTRRKKLKQLKHMSEILSYIISGWANKSLTFQMLHRIFVKKKRIIFPLNSIHFV